MGGGFGGGGYGGFGGGAVDLMSVMEAFGEALVVEPFDGRNWEASAGLLRHLSSG